MPVSSGSVSGFSAGAPRPRPAPAGSAERENALFVESALVALVAAVRASRVQILSDLADIEDRAAGALDAAAAVRGALEAGAPASRESRASAERALAGVGSLLRGREAGAHRSIVLSSADTVEAAFAVARFAAARHLSAELEPRFPSPRRWRSGSGFSIPRRRSRDESRPAGRLT